MIYKSTEGRMILRRTNVPWAQKNLQLHTQIQCTYRHILLYTHTLTHTCVAKKHEEAFNELFSFVLALALACDDKLRCFCPRLLPSLSLPPLALGLFLFYFFAVLLLLYAYVSSGIASSCGFDLVFVLKFC